MKRIDLFKLSLIVVLVAFVSVLYKYTLAIEKNRNQNRFQFISENGVVFDSNTGACYAPYDQVENLKDNIDKLYQYLTERHYYSRSKESFINAFYSNREKRKQLYDSMVSRGLYEGSEEKFNDDYFRYDPPTERMLIFNPIIVNEDEMSWHPPRTDDFVLP